MTGDLPSRGKKYRTPPGPCVPHGGTLRRRRVVYLVAPAKNPPVPANVAAGHSRRGHLRVSDAGGSRRSYRNGRASAVAEGTPFPEGPPKSSVGGGSLLAPVIQRMCWSPPGVASVSFVISVRAYPPLPEGSGLYSEERARAREREREREKREREALLTVKR